MNDTAIMQYIGELDAQFSLVMIADYFPDSLVLLKRLMCWTLKDILYHSSNVRNRKIQEIIPTDEELKLYYNFSKIDFILY